jgi:microcystin-dependent protein
MHASSSHRLGSKSGSEKVTLTTQHLPSHTHGLHSSAARADSANPTNNVLATSASGDRQYVKQDPTVTPMNANAVGQTGSSQSHDNIPPFLCVHFIIALFGIYPSRQ